MWRRVSSRASWARCSVSRWPESLKFCGSCTVIDPKLLRSDPEAVARNMARRGLTLDVEAWRALEEKRKPWQIEADRLRSERNANAKAVGMAKGKGQDAAALIAKGESLTGDLAKAEASLTAIQEELEQWQLGLPNLVHD